jgi:glycosyltransferase involved in cell wall biosynthesis
MNTPPFFTIITASLNSSSTIRRTLESVKNQTFKDLEHIVIDGGSRDGTLDILKEFENTYNFTWISESDHGIADAINKGLRRANGRYIIVIQADDYFLGCNTLKSLYHILKEEKFDIYSFRVLYNPPVKGRKMGKPVQFLWWHRFRNIFPHQGVFVHKRVFDRIGMFNEKYTISMDYDFFYRALINGCRVNFGTMPISVVGGEGVSASHALLPERLKEEFIIQNTNEKNHLWRLAQLLFRSVYLPYKLNVFPKLEAIFHHKNSV